jgi:putative NADH-flavin reductase
MVRTTALEGDCGIFEGFPDVTARHTHDNGPGGRITLRSELLYDTLAHPAQLYRLDVLHGKCDVILGHLVAPADGLASKPAPTKEDPHGAGSPAPPSNRGQGQASSASHTCLARRETYRIGTCYEQEGVAMAKAIVLGASGQIARLAIQLLLVDETNGLTLYLRNAKRVHSLQTDRVRVVEGDVLDDELLTQTVRGQDVAYANLGGDDIEAQARTVVSALTAAGTRRLIWIATLGIYDEVPGEFGKWNHQELDGGYLESQTAAARVIESSDLNYTIIRPAWLTDKPEVDYELTHKGEPFKGTEVSRKSVADLVTQLVHEPLREVGSSLGVDKPGTDAAKPAWL